MNASCIASSASSTFPNTARATRNTRRSCFRTRGSNARRSPASTNSIRARSSSPPLLGALAYSFIRRHETGPGREKIQAIRQIVITALYLFALRTYHMVEIRCSFNELDQIQIEKHDRIFGWARWTGKVGVGIMIAHNPLHGSGRTVL